MDSVLRAGAVREMIVVMPNGENAYGGSFWVNSPATGQWEDYLLRDVVAHVDRRYRTLPRSASRAVAGYSMGGYAALRLAMRHPDTFSTVYALSACCLGPELLADRQMSAAWPATLRLQTREQVGQAGFWSQFQVALASVFSPDSARPLGVSFPVAEVDGSLHPVETVRDRWLAATPERLVREHYPALRRLRGVAFDVGRADGFAHIPVTLRQLSQALTQAGIRHHFEEYEGDHGNRIGHQVAARMLPWVSRTLAHQ
jgi:S-formylglutathione hydrolase FrmB